MPRLLHDVRAQHPAGWYFPGYGHRLRVNHWYQPPSHWEHSIIYREPVYQAPETPHELATWAARGYRQRAAAWLTAACGTQVRTQTLYLDGNNRRSNCQTCARAVDPTRRRRRRRAEATA